MGVKGLETDRERGPQAEARDIQDRASQALRTEAEALMHVAQQLPEGFVDVVRLMRTLSGKVVLSGVGKSGHIARKMASTFASTGTPACFVHPTEAGHGDLGMVVPQEDVLFLLSNSGETAELAPLIHYSRRLGIPLIALTARADSSLGREADHVLTLPHFEEVCPLGLAPTTSALVMLAMGDALAVCLLHLKGWCPSDYGLLHPSGSLGRKLLRVEQVMRRGAELPLVTPDTLMADALLVMTHKGFGCIIVVKDGDEPAPRLLGLVTDGDLRRHMSATLLSQKVSDVMTRCPLTVGPEALAAQALALMNERRITTLVVTEGDALQGLIRVHDCLKQHVSE